MGEKGLTRSQEKGGSREAAKARSEQRLIEQLFTAYWGLKEMGWEDPHHLVDCDDVEMIELGSTGIHRGGYCEGQFWLADDLDTITPVLARKPLRDFAASREAKEAGPRIKSGVMGEGAAA